MHEVSKSPRVAGGYSARPELALDEGRTPPPCVPAICNGSLGKVVAISYLLNPVRFRKKRKHAVQTPPEGDTELSLSRTICAGPLRLDRYFSQLPSDDECARVSQAD